MFPVAYWKTSTLVSNLFTSLYFKSCGSQMCLSRSTRCKSSFGGASTSVDTRQRRSGCPSPTFLYAISTVLSAGLFTVTQPRLLVEQNISLHLAHPLNRDLFSLDISVKFRCLVLSFSVLFSFVRVFSFATHFSRLYN